MDTKLKNRHKISILLAIVVIVSAAAVMVGLYPFFKNESARYEEPVYQQQTFLKYLVYGNYVLSMEQVRNNQGDIISPFQFFFPKAAEEMKNQTEETVAAAETNQADGDVQEGAIENEITVDLSESNSGTRSEYLSHLRQKTMRSYNNWKNCFDSIRNSLDYQILNENGQVISDHSGGKTILGNDKYEFQTVLKYDGMGRMEVVSIHGDNTARLLTLLQDFGDKDPMMEDYWEQFYMNRI